MQTLCRPISVFIFPFTGWFETARIGLRAVSDATVAVRRSAPVVQLSFQLKLSSYLSYFAVTTCGVMIYVLFLLRSGSHGGIAKHTPHFAFKSLLHKHLSIIAATGIIRSVQFGYLSSLHHSAPYGLRSSTSMT